MPFSVTRIVEVVFQLLNLFIIIRILLSWISVPDNDITRPILNFIFDITEPILRLVRNIIPPIMVGGMGLDLSPILAILLLQIVRTVIIAGLRLIGIG